MPAAAEARALSSVPEAPSPKRKRDARSVRLPPTAPRPVTAEPDAAAEMDLSNGLQACRSSGLVSTDTFDESVQVGRSPKTPRSVHADTMARARAHRAADSISSSILRQRVRAEVDDASVARAEVQARAASPLRV